MSVLVPVEEIAAAAADYGDFAFVLVGTAEGSPRITHSLVAFDDGMIVVSIGRRAARALADNPALSVLWPATVHQSMSLIVDGVVSDVPVDGGPTRIQPESAVRHRSAIG